MRQPPPEIRASWPAPNFTNPETRGPALVTVELLALSISSIFLGLRLYVRTRVVRSSLDWDDWLMIAGAVCQSTYRFRVGATGSMTRLITFWPALSQIFGVGVTVCVVLASSKYGWDLHIWDLTVAKMVASRQVSFAGQNLYCTAGSLVRISIFTSYLRLAPPGSLFRRLTCESCRDLDARGWNSRLTGDIQSLVLRPRR